MFWFWKIFRLIGRFLVFYFLIGFILFWLADKLNLNMVGIGFILLLYIIGFIIYAIVYRKEIFSRTQNDEDEDEEKFT